MCKEDITWSGLYNSQGLDNRIKVFKYKLIHNIIPTREHLHKWRILDSPECIQCNTNDHYLHCFISYKYLDFFLNTCSNTSKTCGIQHHMRDRKYIVLGYKFIYIEYTGININ